MTHGPGDCGRLHPIFLCRLRMLYGGRMCLTSFDEGEGEMDSTSGLLRLLVELLPHEGFGVAEEDVGALGLGVA